MVICSLNALPTSSCFEAQEFPESEFSSLHLVTCRRFVCCSFCHLKLCKSTACTPSLFSREETLLCWVWDLMVVCLGAFESSALHCFGLCSLQKGRKFEPSFNTELSRFLDNVWDTRECSVKNSAQHCHKLSTAGERDLAVIPQPSWRAENLLRSNSAYNLYCQLLYLTWYRWVINYFHI